MVMEMNVYQRSCALMAMGHGMILINIAIDRPTYNGKVFSTGAKVSLWMSQDFYSTGDVEVMQKSYPFMAARPTLPAALCKVGSHGHRHLYPSNVTRHNGMSTTLPLTLLP